FVMMPFALQLTDDDQRQDDVVLAEPGERPGIGEQHRRVDDEGLGCGVTRSAGIPGLARTGCSLSEILPEAGGTGGRREGGNGACSSHGGLLLRSPGTRAN